MFKTFDSRPPLLWEDEALFVKSLRPVWIIPHYPVWAQKNHRKYGRQASQGESRIPRAFHQVVASTNRHYFMSVSHLPWHTCPVRGIWNLYADFWTCLGVCVILVAWTRPWKQIGWSRVAQPQPRSWEISATEFCLRRYTNSWSPVATRGLYPVRRGTRSSIVCSLVPRWTQKREGFYDWMDAGRHWSGRVFVVERY